MAKLVIMLRIKDGIFFLKDWLDRYEQLADEIVVLDNGSTDGTVEMLEQHPMVVDIVHTTGYNEGRDKNLMYEHVRLRKPDWCLWLDVDEIFEPAVDRKMIKKMMRSKLVDRYAFRRFHFVDRTHFAVSPYWLNYSAGHDRILWREKRSGYFADLLIDSPNVKGINGFKLYTNFRLKHLGYINKALVDKKAEIYKNILTGDQSVIDTMYLANEKKTEWIDDKSNMRVVRLNRLLNWLLIKQLYSKGLRIVRKLFSNILKTSASPPKPGRQTVAEPALNNVNE